MPADQTVARAAHQTSIQAFVASARAVPEEAWEVPTRSGQWSPAQIGEHLRMVYAVLGRQLAGGAGLEVRTSWWLRLILRFRFLPKILEQGRIPKGARAPREARPGPGPFPREPLLADLIELATRAEDTLASAARDREVTITHHVFGRLQAAQALRFLTVHNDHHARQLDRSGSAA